MPCGELMPVLPPTEEFHLRQQRGRHLHEIDAAAQDGRGKAREIADHAAAERDHQIVALDLCGYQRLGDLLEAGIALRALAFPDDDPRGGDAGGCERALGFVQPVFCDGTVGDDGRARAGTQAGDASAQRLQHVAADDDVIGPVAERDVDGNRIGMFQWCGHGVALIPSVGWSAAARSPHRRARRASMHSSTILSCGTSREAIVKSAFW